MAEMVTEQAAERNRIREEKKRLKQEQRTANKEAKRRAKELAKQEAQIEDETEGSTVSVVLVTIVIIMIWLVILVLFVKTDVGGLGSNVVAPILKDVPVVNRILPNSVITETTDNEEYMGYKSLKEAVDQIKKLELQLEQANTGNTASLEEVAALKAEIERLKTFENNQVEFQRIKTEFYEEVVYAEKGPGADEYRKYYEAMDPTTAEYLYKEVVKEEQVSEEIKDYAQAYSEMKPKEAAAIFEEMTDNLALAAKILKVMEPDDRGKILGVMDAEVAAKLTKIMNPES
ncbi:MAG: hypothetical protein IIV45_05710 [Lachnospiraceae bacterium]|nr:hypothetical protein [Lachnospiraceae bacterium]